VKFGASRSQLYDAQKTARLKWDGVSELWHDDASRDFQETLWDPLDAQVSEVLRSVDQVSTLFARIRSDCEFQL
jgi:acyl transferase domain-containing protein